MDAPGAAGMSARRRGRGAGAASWLALFLSLQALPPCLNSGVRWEPRLGLCRMGGGAGPSTTGAAGAQDIMGERTSGLPVPAGDGSTAPADAPLDELDRRLQHVLVQQLRQTAHEVALHEQEEQMHRAFACPPGFSEWAGDSSAQPVAVSAWPRQAADHALGCSQAAAMRPGLLRAQFAQALLRTLPGELPESDGLGQVQTMLQHEVEAAGDPYAAGDACSGLNLPPMHQPARRPWSGTSAEAAMQSTAQHSVSPRGGCEPPGAHAARATTLSDDSTARRGAGLSRSYQAQVAYAAMQSQSENGEDVPPWADGVRKSAHQYGQRRESPSPAPSVRFAPHWNSQAVQGIPELDDQDDRTDRSFGDWHQNRHPAADFRSVPSRGCDGVRGQRHFSSVWTNGGWGDTGTTRGSSDKMFGAQVEAGRQMMHMGPEEMSLWADEGSISRSRRAASSQSCPGASCSWGSGRYDSSKRVGSKRGPYKKSSHGSAFSVSSAARRDSLPWTREHPEVRSAVRSRKHEAEEQRWFEGLEEVMEQQRGTGQLRASNWLDALKDAVEAQEQSLGPVVPIIGAGAPHNQKARLRASVGDFRVQDVEGGLSPQISSVREEEDGLSGALESATSRASVSEAAVSCSSSPDPASSHRAPSRSAATRSEGSSAPRTRRQKKLSSKKKFDAGQGLPLIVDTATGVVHASEIVLEDGGKADKGVAGEGEWGGITREGGGAAAMDVDEEDGLSGGDGTGEHLSSLPDESSRARKLLTKGHLSRTGPKPHEGRIVVDSKRLEVATHKMMAFPTMKAWLISKGYLKIAHTPQPQWSTILRNEYHRLYQYYLKEKRLTQQGVVVGADVDGLAMPRLTEWLKALGHEDLAHTRQKDRTPAQRRLYSNLYYRYMALKKPRDDIVQRQASVLGHQQRAATVEEIIEKRVRQHEDFFAAGVSESVPTHSSRGDDVARCNTSLVVTTHADMHLATPVARRGRRPKRRLEKGDKNVVGESIEVLWVPRESLSLSAVPSSVSEPDRCCIASLTTEGAGVSADGQGAAADSMVLAADHLSGMSEVSLSGVTVSGEGTADPAVKTESMAISGGKLNNVTKQTRNVATGQRRSVRQAVGRTKGGRGKTMSKVRSGVGKKVNALVVANGRAKEANGDTKVHGRTRLRGVQSVA